MAITKYKTDATPCKTYKALLTQTGELTGTSSADFNWAFIVGETYTITTYESGDDFSNIANVIDGSINQTGCIFIATGKVPADWNNGSQITSGGGLVVNELENGLGFPVGWYQGGPFGIGGYGAFNDDLGPVNNLFPSEKTHIVVQSKFAYNYPGLISVIAGVGTFDTLEVDDFIYLVAYDPYSGYGVDDQLDHISVSIEIYP